MQWDVVQLGSSDYRVREYIVACLRSEALECTSEECRHNAAFQLAFCCMTGYGCPKDDQTAHSWVKRSGKSLQDLSLPIQIATQITKPCNNLHVIRLIAEGYLHEADHAEEYQKLGLLEASEVYYKREISDIEANLRNENLLVRLRLTLTDILKRQGKYIEAATILEQLVTRAENDAWFRKIYFGSLEDFKTRLATLCLHQGSYAKAMSLFQEAIKCVEERLGKHHPQTLSANIDFAHLLQGLGHFQRAEMIVRECLRQTEETLGSDHPATVTALLNIATLLQEQGRKEEALKMMQDIVRVVQKLYGPDDISSIVCMNNLATMTFSIGHYRDAEKLSLDLWERMAKVLGPEHYISLMCLNTHGMCLLLQRKDEAAESALRQALDGIMKARGKNHNDILKFMNSLAILLQAGGRYAEARKIVQPILIARESITVEDVNILRNFVLLGTNFFTEKMHQVSEQLLCLAVEGQQKVLGENSTDALASLATLIELHLDQGDPVRAEIRCRDVLQRCSKGTTDEPVYFKLRNALAVALELQGNLEESVAIQTECLQGYEKLYGVDHLDSLTSMNNLGHVFHKQGKYPESKEMHRRASEGFERTLGPDDPETFLTKNNLALIVAKRGRLEEAISLNEIALKGFLEKYGPEHTSTQKCRNNLDLLLKEFDQRGAKKVFDGAVAQMEEISS